MELEFWATTDVGRVRDHNEDNFLVDKRMKLFVVCDGMGGHAAGEIASAMSVRVVREVMSGHREVFDRLAKDPDNLANRKSVLNLVEHAIQEACLRVYQAAQEDQSRRGMGTTCSLLLLAQGRGFIGHVGDSRIYLYRQGGVHQITEDHSLINEMIRLGKIKKGEEHNLPHKNAVTRAVGVNEFVEVDTFELDVFGGDAFLLCSDGLSGYFEDDSDISDLLDHDDVREVTENAIEFANAGGGKDNITAIAVRVTSEDIHTRDIQRTMEVMRATPFFQYLAYKEMVQMVNLSKRTELNGGDSVFEEGTDPGALFLVVQGKVRLVREGREIANLLPGDYFGETALIDETPLAYSASAAAAGTVVLSFRRERFMELLRGEPDLAVKLLWNFVQTFTARLRPIPYETFLGDRVDEVEEPTPPSGTLVFEEDRVADDGHRPSSVSGEFEALDGMATSSAANSAGSASSSPGTASEPGSGPRKRPSAPRRDEANGATHVRDPNKTLPPGSGNNVSTTAPMRSESRDGRSLPSPDATMQDGEDLAWEDIVPPDLLNEDSGGEPDVTPEELRETVQLDREEIESSERRRRRNHDTIRDIPSAFAGATRPTDDSDASTPSDEERKPSAKPSTPQAQVLKRTKLVVGGDKFDDSEHTREVKPLQERRRNRGEGNEADATIEIDADENIEERS
jgi:serine/threonine protein phosphatase PrpC